MEKPNLFSLEFFQGLHNKEQYYEKITDEENVTLRILNHFIIMVLFSCVYGFIMGCYNGFLQGLSSSIKLPVWFSLIVIICFPAFFVIQTILGSKLTLAQMLSVILAGFVLTTSILVSFAPIVLFFLITGGSYSFIKLLHVAIFALSGFFGMRTIIEALKYSCEKKNIYPKTGVQVFRFWIIIMAFVGAQLSWSLRPFIGAKSLPFQLFREQEGNIYQHLLYTVGDLFFGKGKNVNQKAKNKPLSQPQKSGNDLNMDTSGNVDNSVNDDNTGSGGDDLIK